MPNVGAANTFAANMEAGPSPPAPPGAFDLGVLWANKYGAMEVGKLIVVEVEYVNVGTGQRGMRRSLRLVIA